MDKPTVQGHTKRDKPLRPWLSVNLQPVNAWRIGSKEKSNSIHGRQCVSIEESAMEMERKRREVRPTLQRILS